MPAHRAITYETTEPIQAKGKREPVAAWLAVGPISSQYAPLQGSAFVGRRSEVELLLGVWERAVAQPGVNLVTLLGDPGIGKSRLALELTERVQQLGGRPGTCVSSRTRRVSATRGSGS